MHKITYNKFEQELNAFLKEYLADDSFDQLLQRIDLSGKESGSVSEKINQFYKQQLHIDNNPSKDRIRVDRIITFSHKSLTNEKFCTMLNEIARVCLAEGKIDLANEIFKKAKNLTDNDITKAESILGLADVLSRKSKWTKSIENLHEAKAIFKSNLDYCGLAKCENFLGTIFGELGNISKAKKHLLTSLSLINIDEDLELAANLYSNLGIIYNILENTEVSLNHLNKALNIYDKLSKHKSATEVILNIGLVHYEAENYNAAMENLDMAIENSKEGNYISTLCLTYLAKAQVLIKLNKFHYANEFADKALEISHSSGDKLTLADIYRVKGIIERNLDNYPASESYLLNSLRINKSVNNELNVAETSVELGLLYEKINDTEAKNSYLHDSKNYYKNIEATAKVTMIDDILGFNSAL